MKKKPILIPLLLITGIVILCQCNTKQDSGNQPPNILFAIADDASWPHMSAYGCTWIKTPAFDRVAREGLLFTNAYTPNAKCAPSRSSIITGRNPWQLEEAANHWPFFPAKFKSYAEPFTDNGYHVGFTAKGWGPGIANDADGKRRLLTGTPYNSFKTSPPAQHISDIDYAANFEDFLNKKPDGMPFCFWYGSLEPHRSYEFAASITKGGKSPDDIDKVFGFWPDNDTVRTDMLDYAFEIEYFDSHLATMLELLEKKQLLDNTLIIVTSDNGMPFPRLKGNVYELANHMPLAIMWKIGIKNPGRQINDYVSFIDFAPTYFEVAGIDPNKAGMAPMQGKCLTDIFFSGKTGRVISSRDYVLLGQERHDVGRPHDQGYPVRAIVSDGFMLIKNYEPSRWPSGNPETGYLNTDGSPTKTAILNLRRNQEVTQYWTWNFGKRDDLELYNVENDPECLANLASLDQYTTLINQMLKRMEKYLLEQDDPRVLGNGHIFDEYLYSGENERHFYERFMVGEKLNANWVNASDFENELLD